MPHCHHVVVPNIDTLVPYERYEMNLIVINMIYYPIHSKVLSVDVSSLMMKKMLNMLLLWSRSSRQCHIRYVVLMQDTRTNITYCSFLNCSMSNILLILVPNLDHHNPPTH